MLCALSHKNDSDSRVGLVVGKRNPDLVPFSGMNFEREQDSIDGRHFVASLRM